LPVRVFVTQKKLVAVQRVVFGHEGSQMRRQDICFDGLPISFQNPSFESKLRCRDESDARGKTFTSSTPLLFRRK